MIRNRILGAILIAQLFSQCLFARQYIPIPIGDLLSNVDVVALVQIYESEYVVSPNDNLPCGVRYVSKVIKPIKGAKVDEMINFGNVSGFYAGGKYLVFIKRVDKNSKLIIPGVTRKSDSTIDKAVNSCGEYLSRNIIWSDGAAMFPLVFDFVNDKYFFEVSSHAFSFPISMQDIENDDSNYPKKILIDRKKLLDYLGKKGTGH